MKALVIFICLLPLMAFADWQIDGSLAVDGETFPISQKFQPGKEVALDMGNFLCKLTFKEDSKKKVTVTYAVFEKKGGKQILITKGDEEMDSKDKDIYAKGEPNQPNSIINLKLKNI